LLSDGTLTVHVSDMQAIQNNAVMDMHPSLTATVLNFSDNHQIPLKISCVRKYKCYRKLSVIVLHTLHYSMNSIDSWSRLPKFLLKTLNFLLIEITHLPIINIEKKRVETKHLSRSIYLNDFTYCQVRHNGP
jgi:hypothetical protein